MSKQDRKFDDEATVKRLQGLTGVPETHVLNLLKGNDGDFRSALHTIWTMYHTCQSYTWTTSAGGEGAKPIEEDGSSSALEDAIQVKMEVSNKEQVEQEVQATTKLVQEVIRRFYVPERRAWKLLRTSHWSVEEVGTKVQLNKTYSLADHPQLRQVYMSFFGNPELSNMRCSNVAVSNAVDSYIADQCVEHVTFLMRDFGAGKTSKDHKGGGTPVFIPASFRLKPSRSGSKGHIVEIEDSIGHNKPANAKSAAACRTDYKEIVKVDCDLASAPPKFSLVASGQVYTFCIAPHAVASASTPSCGACYETVSDRGGFYVSTPKAHPTQMLCRSCGSILAKNHDYELKFLPSFDTTKKSKKEAKEESGEEDKEPTVPFSTGHRFLKMLTGMRSHHSSFLAELFRRLQLDESGSEADLLSPLQYGPDGSVAPVTQEEMEGGYGPPTTLLNTVVLKLPWVAAQEGGVFIDDSFAFGHVIVDQTVTNDLNLESRSMFGATAESNGVWGANTTLVLSDWYGSLDSTTLLDPSIAKNTSVDVLAAGLSSPMGAGTGAARPSSLQCIRVRQLPNPRHPITEVSDRLPDAAKATVSAQMGSGGGFGGGPPTTGLLPKSLLQACRPTHVTLVDLSALPFLEKLEVSTPVLLHPDAVVKTIGDSCFAKGWSTNATLPAVCGNMRNFLPKSQSRLPTVFEQLPHLKVIPEGCWSDCQFDPPVLDLRSCLNSLTTIQTNAFRNCLSLVSVDLGISTLTTIDNDVFAACPTLHSLSLANASSLTSIGRNFASGCKGLSTVLLPGCKRSPASSTLTEIGSGFCCNCNQLNKVDFSGCTELGPQLGLWCIDTTFLSRGLRGPSASAVRLRELDLTSCTKLVELDHGSQLFTVALRRPAGPGPVDGEGTVGGGWCDANLQNSSSAFGGSATTFSPSIAKKGWEMYWAGQGTKVLLAPGVQGHLEKSFSGGATAAQKVKPDLETKEDGAFDDLFGDD